MQIDLVGQPGVNGAPVSSLGFLVVPLLDHAQAFSLFPVERTDTIHRVIASVNAPVVARPLFWRYVVISHKKIKRARSFRHEPSRFLLYFLSVKPLLISWRPSFIALDSGATPPASQIDQYTVVPIVPRNVRQLMPNFAHSMRRAFAAFS